MSVMEILPQTRRSRFRRHRFGKPPLVLQERDQDIIRLVADYRFITSEEIQALVPGSDQTVLRRLQKLFHGGYLDRPRSQQQRGNGKMIYALGYQGAHLLARLSGDEQPAAIDWSEKNRQVRLRYLEHTLMVSRFRTALTLAMRLRPEAVVDAWKEGNDLRDAVVVAGEYGSERIPIAPDALFVLRLTNEPDGRNRIHIFLEADRGTMTTKRFVTKMRGYWHFWQSGRQEERFGMKNFLVLTIASTHERAMNLCAATQEIDAEQHLGLRMLLFGSEREYSVQAPLPVLEPIWTTAAGGSRHSIVE